MSNLSGNLAEDGDDERQTLWRTTDGGLMVLPIRVDLEIDLHGPLGNAYALEGFVISHLEKCPMAAEHKAEAIRLFRADVDAAAKDGGDYDRLVEICNRYVSPRLWIGAEWLTEVTDGPSYRFRR